MRQLIFVVCLSFCSACFIPKIAPQETPSAPLQENTSHLWEADLTPFYHGVASGDPHASSVLLWTRVTPPTKTNSIPVLFQIATDVDFNNVVDQGSFTTTPARDYTVKAIADRLEPGTKYFYRFRALGKYSMVGQTKTAPTDTKDIKFAVVSCSNIEFGYFNAYAAIADEELDAVLHLGDYIYEYGPDTYGDKSFSRKNIPAKEIISLQDYRDRYAQYRLDEDLRTVHAKHPFINIWDDHEITNNAYVDGAENHQANEGDYNQRKAIAKQVYYEWLPIREQDTHYRQFSYGEHVDLFMLDERLAGRTVQPDSIDDPKRVAPENALLGKTQMDWLIQGLSDSKATWKVIGNQVIFSYSDWGYKTFGLNMDAWDGYPREQAQLTGALRKKEIDNVIFVTGDTHTAWAFEATNDPFENYNANTGAGAVGVEFGVTSITSANPNERFPDEEVRAHETKISNSNINPHLKYVNMRDHGYLVLELQKGKSIASYKIIETLKEKNKRTKVDKVFEVQSGQNKLIYND